MTSIPTLLPVGRPHADAMDELDAVSERVDSIDVSTLSRGELGWLIAELEYCTAVIQHRALAIRRLLAKSPLFGGRIRTVLSFRSPSQLVLGFPILERQDR